MKGVSLFDFDSASEETAFEQAYGNVFVPKFSAVLLIGIELNWFDRAKLQTPDEVSKGVYQLRLSGCCSGRTHVPDIEAIYLDEVPSSAFSKLCLAAQDDRFFETPPGVDAMKNLNEKSMEWNADDELAAAKPRESGEPSLAEMIAESYRLQDDV